MSSALPLLVVSILARLPLAMMSIGLLVHAQRLTGSFAAAGLVGGTLAVAQGVGGPVLGRLVDRHGQTLVLATSATVGSVALCVVAALPTGAPAVALAASAALLGLSCPPVAACLRAILPSLVTEDALRRAYAIDAAATEVTWVAGPPVVILLAALGSTGVALAVTGALMLTATAAFAASSASRRWRPRVAAASGRGGALRAPALRLLVGVLVGVGALFGATEVAVVSATDALDAAAAAGPLLGLWGIGSLAGGILAARAGGGARTGVGLALLLAVLAAGHGALAGAAGSVVAMAIVIALAGTMIAPILASAYAMVDRVAPAGTVTEAFAWLATATAVGSSLGAGVAGAVVDTAGPAAAFVVAGGAAAVAAVLAALRAPVLAGAAPGAPVLAAAA
jgi:hypothetical protein